jgi:hypothetical protein
MKKIIKYFLRKMNLLKTFQNLKIEKNKELILLGKIYSNLLVQNDTSNIQNNEFSIYSQSGDDGIIQYLINRILIYNKCFIEFGVENYKEANTRFLLINNNWSGLVMDSSKEFIDQIKKDNIYWQYDLLAVQAFITMENINELIASSGIGNKIGLLHIDLVGNNYWVWKEMSIQPDIVSIEYNSIFGKDKAITIPYYPDFYRTAYHYSNLYFGCSLPALVDLSTEKGYVFIGSNSIGTTAYFIRKDKAAKFRELSVEEGYVCSKFRESRDKDGILTYIRGEERVKALSGLPVFNTRSGLIEYFS